MRLLLSLLLLCAISPVSSAQMLQAISNNVTHSAGSTPTLVNKAQNVNTTGTTVSVAYTPTTGNFVFGVCAGFNNVTVVSLSDGGTNTYTQDFFQAASTSSSRMGIYRKFNVTGGAFTYTCTFSGSATGSSIFIEEWANIQTAAAGDGTPATQFASNGTACGAACTTFTSGSTTTTHASDLLVVGLSTDSGSAACTITSTGSWTLQQHVNNGLNDVCSAVLTQVVAVTGTYQGTATVDNVFWAGGIAGYKGL